MFDFITDRLDAWHLPLLFLWGALAAFRWTSRAACGQQDGAAHGLRKFEALGDRLNAREGDEWDVLLVIVFLLLAGYPLISSTYCQNVKCRGHDRLEPKPFSMRGDNSIGASVSFDRPGDPLVLRTRPSQSTGANH